MNRTRVTPWRTAITPSPWVVEPYEPIRDLWMVRTSANLLIGPIFGFANAEAVAAAPATLELVRAAASHQARAFASGKAVNTAKLLAWFAEHRSQCAAVLKRRKRPPAAHKTRPRGTQ